MQIKRSDIFEVSIDFHYGGKRSFQSSPGTCISISVVVLDIFLFSKKKNLSFPIARFGSKFLFSSQTLLREACMRACDSGLLQHVPICDPDVPGAVG